MRPRSRISWIVIAALLAAVPAADAAGPRTPRLHAFVIAGNGAQTDKPVTGPALRVPLESIRDVALDSEGRVLVLAEDPDPTDFGAGSPAWVLRLGRDGHLRRIAGVPEGQRCPPPEPDTARSPALPPPTPAPRSGRARTACLPRAAALAALPGGDVLVATQTQVHRITAAGDIATVAGSGVRGFRGDGGPAVDADLADVTDLTALPDGGYAIADHSRIRRVDATGIITTIAGDGTRPASLYSSPIGPAPLPATETALAWPLSVGLLPDARLLIGQAAAPVLRRLDPDGLLRPATAMSSQDLRAIAVTTDGLTYGASFGSLRRLRPDGTTPIGEDSDSRPPLLDGAPVSGRRLDVRALGAGGRTLIAGTARHLVLLTPIPSETLAVAPRPGQARATRRGYTIAPVLSRPARLTVELRRAGRIVAAVRRRVGAGKAMLVIGRRLRPGLHHVRLRAQADGRVAVRSHHVVLGGVLRRHTAQAIVRRIGRDELVGTIVIGRCRRLGDARIDCVLQRVREGQKRCRVILSVQLAASGRVRVGSHSCRQGLTRAPGWALTPTAYPLEALRP